MVIQVILVKSEYPMPLSLLPLTRGNGIKRIFDGHGESAGRYTVSISPQELPPSSDPPPNISSPEYRIFKEWLREKFSRDLEIVDPIIFYPKIEGEEVMARLNARRKQLLGTSQPAEVCAEYD